MNNETTTAPAPTTPATSAMLVHLKFHAGKQGGTHDEATSEICESRGADPAYLEAKVKYICPEAYAPINTLKGEFTKKIKRLTTPSGIASVYLAKASAIPKILALRDEYFPAFELMKAHHLIGRREEWLEMTKEKAKEAFKPEHFPSAEQMEADCRWSLSVMPLPEGELLRRVKELDEALVDELVKSQDEHIKKMLEAAKAEAYTRMVAPIQKIVESLSKDKVRIYESLVSNVAEVVDAMSDLNHDNDPTLAAFAEEAKAMLKDIDLAELKKDPLLRKEVVEKAKTMLNNFGKPGMRKFSTAA